MTDHVAVRGLRVRGFHGVLPEERRDGQDFIVDAVLGLDISAAAEGDDLARAVDYSQVAHRLSEIVAGAPVNLIETLAERLAAACLSYPAVEDVEITVHKPSAPIGLPVDDVTVTIRRASVRMTAVVSLGSNLGDRLGHLRAGIAALREHVDVAAVSAVYETEPLGVAGQPAYLNAVALLATDDPERALAAAQAAEISQGRERPSRWAARTLDVDVVAVGSITSDDPRLTVPHPRAHERAFVLVPWLDVEPAAELPGHGPVADIPARLDDEGVRWYADPEAIA